MVPNGLVRAVALAILAAVGKPGIGAHIVRAIVILAPLHMSVVHAAMMGISNCTANNQWKRPPLVLIIVTAIIVTAIIMAKVAAIAMHAAVITTIYANIDGDFSFLQELAVR